MKTIKEILFNFIKAYKNPDSDKRDEAIELAVEEIKQMKKNQNKLRPNRIKVKYLKSKTTCSGDKPIKPMTLEANKKSITFGFNKQMKKNQTTKKAQKIIDLEYDLYYEGKIVKCKYSNNTLHPRNIESLVGNLINKIKKRS